MQTEIYQLDWAGEFSFDVFTKNGRYAGLISGYRNGTFRHMYNGQGTKGSKKIFASVEAALENLHNRRMKKIAKRNAN